MILPSLRTRFALAFAGLSWGILAVSGTVLYYGTSRALDTGIRREMASTLDVLLHRVEEDRYPVDKELLDVGEHLSVRVLDRERRLVLESRPFAEHIPRWLGPPEAQRWHWFEDRDLERRGFRLVSAPTRVGWILVARDVHSEREVLRRFRLGFYHVLGAAPLVAGLLGYFVAALGLAPLRRLAEQARRIRPATLGQPLDLGGLPQELRPLGEALNASMRVLEAAFAQLSRLNGELAHELRTPLHAMHLDLEGLLTALPEAHPMEDRLGSMMESLDHLRHVIEQMLQLAQAEDPARGVVLVGTPAPELLARASAPFRPMAEDRRVHLGCQAEPGLVVTADATLLRRALHNLLSNALRHTPAGGRVILRVSSDSEGVQLDVEDTGPGMSPEAVACVGRRFLRFEEARDRARGGTGLGLAIVQGIAARHNGQFQLLPAPGGGLLARIRLPRG